MNPRDHHIEIKPAGKVGLNLEELKEYKELFYFFTWRDIKVKYKQTVLGFIWAVLQPLLMMIIFTLFFGQTLNLPSQQIPYPIHVFSGLILWNLFASGLTGASNSMVVNINILKKVYFPRLIMPISAILVSLFDFLMSLFIFFFIIIIYTQQVSIFAILLWPLSLFVAILATLGPGLWMAALNVKYRDFRYVIPFMLQIMFFLTPIIYPITLVKSVFLEYVFVLSPLYAAIELFRIPLTGAEVNFSYILISVLSGVVLLVVGLMYFRRTENSFADLG